MPDDDDEAVRRPSKPAPAQAQGLGMRIVGGQFRGRALAAPGDDRDAAHLRPRARGGVQHPRARHRRTSRSKACACSTCLPAPARSASRRCRAAPPTACSSRRTPTRAPLIRRNVEAFGLTGITKIFRRDATKLGPAGNRGSFGLRLPRSALRQGPGRAGAGLRRRRRLAGARRHRRHRGAQGRSHRPARGFAAARSAHLGRYAGAVRALCGVGRVERSADPTR